MPFSYSFRDRPRLSDRIRGKSGDELFKELRKELDDQDQRPTSATAFDNRWGPSTGSAFSRAGYPFDDSLLRGRTDIKSHLEDLAQRHPEFAEHLQYPAWGNSDSSGRKRRESEEQAHNTNPQPPPEQQHTAQPQSQPQPPVDETEESGLLRGRAKENLRNTVPDMGQKQQEGEDKESRGQRSWSAPPDNRTQTDKPRFVSKIEIQPVNPDAVKPSDATKPPMAPPKPQPQPQTQQQPPHPQPKQPQSNVRHIPIFVEGRDEPVLPKNIEPEFTQSQAPTNQQHFSRPQQQSQCNPQHYEQNQRFEQQQQHTQPPQTKTEQPTQQTDQHPPEPPVNTKDPLYRVSCVQKEVDELKTKVDGFKGTSRSDKEYILLDELLTRNLIKLDDIETEGKDEVRAARKNTIKSIQRCISVLENKIPAPGGEKEEGNIEVEQNVDSGIVAEGALVADLPEEQQKMDVDSQPTAGVASSEQVKEGEVKNVPSAETPVEISDEKAA